ncbi:MAG TPA: hypothetical protein VFH38_11655 [Jatrophihabitans sp.]|nr:hypothetical protein [Jatrophihabitans sp.]
MKSDLQCELVADHRSMHAARSGSALMHWRDPHMPADYATHVSLQWAVDGSGSQGG